MLAAGPRDVMVPASAVETARALLATEVPDVGAAEDELSDATERPSRLAFKVAALLLAALLLFGAVVGAVYAVAY